MATKPQETTRAPEVETQQAQAPQPGVTPAEPEHPEDIVVNDGRDDAEPQSGNPISRFFGRLLG